ncbi:MAG: hypothetical protein WD534_06835 [Phycisphaeraceae bacterium]
MKAWYSIAVVMVAALMLGLSTGCETGPGTVDRQAPSLELATSQNGILVGETTTVFAQTANLLGRDVEIRWGTTLGEITPARSGRVAQFSSDVPGTAVVTAEINADGQVLRDSVNITVNSME